MAVRVVSQLPVLTASLTSLARLFGSEVDRNKGFDFGDASNVRDASSNCRSAAAATPSRKSRIRLYQISQRLRVDSSNGAE